MCIGKRQTVSQPRCVTCVGTLQVGAITSKAIIVRMPLEPQHRLMTEGRVLSLRATREPPLLTEAQPTPLLVTSGHCGQVAQESGGGGSPSTFPSVAFAQMVPVQRC